MTEHFEASRCLTQPPSVSRYHRSFVILFEAHNLIKSRKLYEWPSAQNYRRRAWTAYLFPGTLVPSPPVRFSINGFCNWWLLAKRVWPDTITCALSFDVQRSHNTLNLNIVKALFSTNGIITFPFLSSAKWWAPSSLLSLRLANSSPHIRQLTVATDNPSPTSTTNSAHSSSTTQNPT